MQFSLNKYKRVAVENETPTQKKASIRTADLKRRRARARGKGAVKIKVPVNNRGTMNVKDGKCAMIYITPQILEKQSLVNICLQNSNNNN